MHIPKQLELTKPLIKVVSKNHNGKRCYVIDGEENYYPSVTTVLGCRGKKAIYEWRARVGEEAANKVSREASGNGTALHSLCELYLKGDPNFNRKKMQVPPNASARFNKLTPALERIDGIYFQEQKLVSNLLEVGGTVDLFGSFDNEISIIDFKTSRRKKRLEDIMSYFAQCYAYGQCVYEMYDIEPKKAVIIMSYEDSYEIFSQDIKYGKEFFIESIRMFKRGLID